jgi:hypothetical protein
MPKEVLAPKCPQQSSLHTTPKNRKLENQNQKN